MNVRTQLIIGTVFLKTLDVYSQDVKSADPLKTGEVLPDKVYNVLNAPYASAHLKDYRGKVIILDFWATWCTSCIAKFPHLDSLLKENQDKLQVFLVNQDNIIEDSVKVEKFLTRYRKKNPTFKLPTIVNDTLLPKLFPHRTIPHYVIINREGNYISTSREIPESKLIQQIFEGNYSNIVAKKEFLDFEPNKPLFIKANGGEERQILQKSFFTSYLEGIPSTFRYVHDIKNNTSRLLVRNFPLLNLYKKAYQVKVPLSYTVFEVKNPNRFQYGTGDALKAHMYTYELYSFDRSKKDLLEILKSDLYSYFGARARMEKRKVKCRVLYSDLPINEIGSKTKSAGDGEVIYGVGDLVIRLNHLGSIPTFNGIDSKENIIIDFNGEDVTNEHQLSDVLKRNNLKTKIIERELDVFVVYED